MNTKKSSILVAAGIIIVIALGVFMFSKSKDSKISQNQNTTDAQMTVTPTPEVRFVVVRVLPSGFSPDEVTIETGMIVRFTNPLTNKVTLTWDGDTQYTDEPVFSGNDIATILFDTEGEYTFTSSANASNSGKVVVR